METLGELVGTKKKKKRKKRAVWKEGKELRAWEDAKEFNIPISVSVGMFYTLMLSESEGSTE